MQPGEWHIVVGLDLAYGQNSEIHWSKGKGIPHVSETIMAHLWYGIHYVPNTWKWQNIEEVGQILGSQPHVQMD